MKKLTGFLSLILFIVLIISISLTSVFPAFAEAPACVTINSISGGNFVYGIDVSSHNGSIDWARVKQSGVQFAMIRCGYRGYLNGRIVMDTCFEYNIINAYNNGIAVGVYFYSTAVNTAEAAEEAAYVLSLVNAKAAQGIYVTYPIAYDFEEFYNNDDRSRAKTLSKAQVSADAAAFLDYIRASGYTPLFYAGKNPMKNNFESYLGTNYPLWLANYVNATEYEGKFFMWQFTSSGSVDGISGRVDFDVCGFENSDNLQKVTMCNRAGVVAYNKPDASSGVAMALNANQIYLYRNTYSSHFKELKINGKYCYVPSLDISSPFVPTEKKYKTAVAAEKYIYPFDDNSYKSGAVLPAQTDVNLSGIWGNWAEVKYGGEIYYLKTDTLITCNHTGGIATCHSKAICALCGEEYGELGPDNHDGETEIRNAKNATCISEGYSGDIYCLSCGKLIFTGNFIAKKEHSYGWRTTELATEDKAGLKEECCSFCGQKTGRTEKIAYTGHITGDIDGNGSVNNLDLVLLFQYLSGWEVNVKTEALDTNGDSTNNNLDLITLFHFLSGWNTDIY